MLNYRRWNVPVGIPDNFGEHVKLMFDLQWLAYQADITRVFTFMYGREVGSRTYPEIGLSDGHHSMSHHGDRAENLERLAKLNTYQADLFAYFLEKLRSTPDGDGTLLDHSLLLYGAGLSNPKHPFAQRTSRSCWRGGRRAPSRGDGIWRVRSRRR